MNEREYDIMFEVEDRHWWYVALHDLIGRFVDHEAGKRGRLEILDAGCGTGRLCQLLAPRGRVTGCDLAEKALDLCRKRGIDAFAADLNGADLGVGRYDVITAIDVLYHRAIVDDAAVLARFYRALKPDGLLILNLVAHEFLRSSHDLAVHTRKRYSRADFLPELTRTGFAVEKASYRLGFLFFPIAAYRLVKRAFRSEIDPVEIASDLRMPSPFLNRFLLRLALAENGRIEHGSLPLGTSLFITARKPRGAGGNR